MKKKYLSLMKDTLIFSLGSFGSKIMITVSFLKDAKNYMAESTQ